MATERINPDMLVLAREARGLSQGELAKAIGASQAKVSKFENGIFDVPPEDLRQISRVLHFNEAFFCQRDKVYGLGSSLLFNRKLATVPLTVQRRVQANVNVLRMQVERLLRSAEVEAGNSFEQLDPDRYNGDVAEVARRVRAGWRLPAGPIRNLTNAVETAGGIVLLCNFGTEGISAAHLWLPDLPPLFFLNGAMPADRYRFTLAHEIGHAVMHRFPTGDVEEQAHTFAREFLMPSQEIRAKLEDLTLEKAAQLKMTWKVSMQAIIVHAHALGCISDRQYQRLLSRMSVAGYRKQEPIDIAPETPSIVPQLVQIHRNVLGYSDADLSRMLFTTDSDFYDLNGVRPPDPDVPITDDALNFQKYKQKMG